MTDERLVVRGTRRAMKEMADGTIRVSIDIDPPFRLDFLRLFPNIDTAVAIAPLQGAGALPDTKVDEKPKGGPLARLAATWCNDEAFWTWLAEMYPDAWGPAMKKADTEAEIAVLCLYELCDITSRVELDNDEAAASRFHMLVREPFSLHLRETA